jgi:hypothetical protein
MFKKCHNIAMAFLFREAISAAMKKKNPSP